MYDALVISDIHLGSDVCCAKQLLRFLELLGAKEVLSKRLILNGDVFDSHDFRRLKKNHWKILSLLRKLSDDIEIVWLRGNHDGPSELLSHLLGVSVADEYLFCSGDERVLLFHGDMFDDFLNAHPVVTWIADVFYGLFQKIDKSSNLCRWVKSQSKTYLRCAEKIEKKAIQYARKQNASVVCCGHVHKAECSHHDGVNYYNSGTWTESPCTYLAVMAGSVELRHFNQENHILEG